MPYSRPLRGFTLIELLIVVAIIAILAAIAIPNFLEAQVRSKVSRVKADLRSLATAIEAYSVDNNVYPAGTDSVTGYPQDIVDFLGPLASGYYTFRTRTAAGAAVGQDFASVTTPIAYITTVPLDPFISQLGGRLMYCYRSASTRKNAYVLTCFGPDADALAPNGKGTSNPNPVGTFADTANPSRLGDISERSVVHYMEETNAGIVSGVRSGFGSLPRALDDLTYDPTNGTISDGDLYRMGP